MTKIENFGKNYNFVEIYSDSKVSKPEKSFNNPDLIDNNSIGTNTVIKTTIKASKITNSDFDKIYESCIESKQTWVIRQYKPITSAKKKLEEDVMP